MDWHHHCLYIIGSSTSKKSDGPDYFSFGVSDQDREELEDTMFSDNKIEVRDKAQEQLNIVLQDLPKDQVSE